MYEVGHGMAAKDEKKAVELYHRACHGGNANGCSSLGWAFVRGVGVIADRERGIALLRKGCSGGNAWGCDKLQKMGVAP
jgi:TPR repeat protein